MDKTEIVVTIILFVMMLFWFDLGQGPDYTWWGIIRDLSNK